MSRREIGFVERHVEKLAMGFGGVLMFVAAGMVVLGRANSAETAEVIPAEVGRITARLGAAEPTSRGPELPLNPEALKAAPAATPPAPHAALVAVAPATVVWEPPVATIICRERPTSRVVLPPAVTQPPVAPKAVEAVPARGFAPLKPGAPKAEFLGVQLRLDLDAEAIYRQWWPLYRFLRDRTVAQARANLVAPKDIKFAEADADFAFRWRLIVFGVEIEQQAYDPVLGWEKDEAGGDLWRKVEKPWGKVGEAGWLKMLAECNNDDELPPFPARAKSPALQTKFEQTRDKLVSAYSAVRSDCQWPAPPGPAGVDTLTARGERPVPARSWLPMPKPVAVVPPPAPNAPPAPKVKNDPDGLVRDKSAEKRAAGAPAPAAVKSENAELTLDEALQMRLADGGAVRPLSAFVIDDSLQPGRTYRFRARVLVRNPAFDWEDAAPAEVENKFHLATDWTPPSAPVTLPENIRFYLISGEKGGGADSPIHRPLIQVFRWTEGAWYASKLLRPAPGDIIRPARKEELIKPNGGYPQLPFAPANRADVERALGLMDTGCVLLDVWEAPVVLERQPNKATGRFQPSTGNRTCITYLDADGVMHTRVAAYDAADLKKWDLK